MSSPARPLVTIGISTYNRANSYLGGALHSALDQTYPNLEIVVSDNGSTDNTEALVRGLGDSRIRYFRQDQNIGANPNFNFCLRQARGAYFLLLHDDDMIDKDFVDVCMTAVEDDTTVGIIRTGTRVIDTDGAVVRASINRVGGLSTTDFMLGWFSGQTALYLCSTLFNTRRLQEMGGFQSRTFVFQDVVAEVRLAAHYGRADVADVKASFRRHGDNRASPARLQDWVEDSLFLLEVMCELVPEGARERVHREGRAYFCRKSYRYAAAIPSLKKRLQAYYAVHRRFGYAYSPLHYMSARQFRSLKRHLRKALGPTDENRVSGS